MRHLLLITFLLTTFIPGASAQDDGAGESETSIETQYQDLIRRALAEMSDGRWREARALFRQAHELSPNARTLRGIGMVSYELQEYVNAIRELRRALADEQRALTDRQRVEVEALIAQAAQLVGTYDLSAIPEGASVTVDGHAIEPEPDGTLLLAAGEHEVHVQGEQRWESRFTVRGGENEPLPIVFEEAAPAPSPVIIRVEEAPPPIGAYVLLVGGAAAVIAGVGILIAGLVDFFGVEGATRGARWSEYSGAYNRAPVLTGLGFGLIGVGGALTVGGGVWVAGTGGSSAEAAPGETDQAGFRLTLRGMW